jgi:HCO3- transporter family
MSPRNGNETPSHSSEGEDDVGGKSATFRSSGTIPNEDVMEDAGKITIDEGHIWGKAVLMEIKRTIGTHWIQEMINFNQKTIAVSILMFITVVSPTLTFGAVYGKVTGNLMGTIETLLATTWVGCFMALFSGMPVAIIGSTGEWISFCGMTCHVILNSGSDSFLTTIVDLVLAHFYLQVLFSLLPRLLPIWLRAWMSHSWPFLHGSPFGTVSTASLLQFSTVQESFASARDSRMKPLPC